MTPEVIERFRGLGATQTARLTGVVRNLWGQPREEVSDDLVYFFDVGGKELGYWTAYNNGVCLISREWSEEVRRRHVFQPLP